MIRDQPVPRSDAVLDAGALTCATLTPALKARMRPMTSGQVLEVFSDDPAARVGIPAWSRLTGNELLTSVEVDLDRTRFYLRKK